MSAATALSVPDFAKAADWAGIPSCLPAAECIMSLT
jgi:hypothetical protein